MNTKTFAQLARKILLKGVRDKLRYWGLDAKGQAAEEPQPVPGGYLFRGQPYDDPSVPALWQSLRRAVQHKGLDTVAEEAAYTWFNRMMAIRILAKNGYDPAQLEFVEGAGRLPLLLQRAQRGAHPFLSAAEKARLQKVIADHTRETEAFAILLIGYCHHHTLLQTVFGSIDDYTELLLPDDILAEEGFLHLLNTTDAISDDDYRKVELIGWLYQFYISEKKDEVFAGFKKNKKAEAADIPAATQIFTPNWIVKYMVQNTVGKIWLDLHPDSPLKANMKYLVEGDNPEYGKPIISEVVNLKLLDPAAGSGHILVEAFDLLYDMYLAEYYPPEEAVESILRHNLFGLDIDKRAAQLAQFALLLKAAARHRDILKKGLRPHIYAMPEPRPFSRQEALDFLGKDGLAYADKLFDALQLMQQAQNLGSILRFELPETAVAHIARRWKHFREAQDLNFHEKTLLPALSAYLPVLLILCDKYEAVVANPPYMGQGNMNGPLKDYVNKYYPISKSDLMTVFMEVIPKLTLTGARFALINLPSWLFLSSFEKLREKYITDYFFESLLHMGRGIFGIDFGSVAFSVKKERAENRKGSYFRLHERNFQHIYYEDIEKLFLYSKGNKDYKYDFSQYRDEEGVTEIPEQGTPSGLKIFYPGITQANFSKIPGSPIAYWVSENVSALFSGYKRIGDLCEVKHGLSTGKNEEVVRFWTEISFKDIGLAVVSSEDTRRYIYKWFPYNKGGTFRKWYGNQEFVLRYDDFGLRLMESFTGFRHDGKSHYFQSGITWSFIGSGSFACRFTPKGFIFDVSGSSLFTNNVNKILGYLCSSTSYHFLKVLNPTINFQVGNLKSLPISPRVFLTDEIENFTANAVEISRQDWDSRETSWDFQRSPLLNDQPNLRRAYEAWQAAVTRDFFQLHANEEELNRIFIDIYGLQDELRPEVALKDITILQDELDGKDLEALEPRFRAQGAEAVTLPIQRDVVMQQFLSYLVGVCMGRYRLDKPGLHIAHPAPASEEIAPYRYNGHPVEIDEDAILPLMGTACEFPDDALQRVKHLLDVVWGPDTRTDNLNFLQECLDQDLEKYLVKQFWKDHCRRYKKKPIYWLFSSPGGAFQVLVYMHRMNPFTAERIRDKYLLPHIKHLRGKVQALDSRAALLSGPEARQLDRLRKDLAECEAYELVLKDVADRQIAFDLDDGVTRNYELFEGVVAEIK